MGGSQSLQQAQTGSLVREPSEAILPPLRVKDLISEGNDSASFDVSGYYINRYGCH